MEKTRKSDNTNMFFTTTPPCIIFHLKSSFPSPNPLDNKDAKDGVFVVEGSTVITYC